MRIIEIARISFTNLRANRMRTLLTIVGISIGIATIVFLVSLGYGLQQLSIKKIASIEAINTIDIAPGKSAEQRIDASLMARLKENPKVDKVSPLLALGSKMEYEGRLTDAVCNFVDDDYARLEGLNPIVGAFFANSSKDIVVTTALLKAINLQPNSAVNKPIKAKIVIIDSETRARKNSEKDFNIIGVIQDDSTAYAFAPFVTIASEIGDRAIYNSLKVKVKDKSTILELKQTIASMGYSATSIADTISEVDQIFRIIQLVLAFFGLVALMVASIGMFNTMTIALLERTRDIGIMKAIGVKDQDVSRIFLSESALIATSGGILGVVLGWLTGKLVNLAINLLAQSVGGESQTLFSIPAILCLGIIAFSIAVGIATGFYPSKRASRLNPLDALRYE